MIIFGWGKGAKKLADIGFNKCPNCKNYSWFYLCELSSKVKVYFVPVAKFNKKYYMVCSVCSAGLELTSKEKDEILRESVEFPSQELSIEIWNKLDDMFSKLSEAMETDKSLDAEEFIERATSELREQYDEKYFDVVAQTYLQYINDDDLPK